MFNNYSEVLLNAKTKLNGVCNICPDCNGLFCKGKIPGVGGKGGGAAFTDAREYLKSIKINVDAVHEHFDADTKIKLLWQDFELPFFVAPIGGMKLNYADVITEKDYAFSVIAGAHDAGALAFTGDGPADEILTMPLDVIRETGFKGIATIKPWEYEKCMGRINMAKDAGSIAIAMDIDSASLINLKLAGKPVYCKSGEEIKQIAKAAQIPFIVKGILNEKSAIKCKDAGCYGIVVSNHGGRTVEDAPAPASKLREIRAAVGPNFKIFVDGGIRTGADIFKCIALGADAVLIGRPFAIAAIGGGREGVKMLFDKLKAELCEIMLMTNCKTISDITMDKIIL